MALSGNMENRINYFAKGDLEDEIENGAGCSILLNAIDCPACEDGADEMREGKYIGSGEGEIRASDDV